MLIYLICNNCLNNYIILRNKPLYHHRNNVWYLIKLGALHCHHSILKWIHLPIRVPEFKVILIILLRGWVQNLIITAIIFLSFFNVSNWLAVKIIKLGFLNVSEYAVRQRRKRLNSTSSQNRRTTRSQTTNNSKSFKRCRAVLG